MMPASLRRRLLLVGGTGVLLVSLLASVLLGLLVERGSEHRLDLRLEQDLLSVLAQLHSDADGQPALRAQPNDARFQRVFSGSYWQVSTAGGQVLWQSRSLWDHTLQLPATATRAAQSADQDGPLQQPLRTRSRQVSLPRSKAPLWVVVASDRSAQDAEVRQFRWYAGLALLAMAAAGLAVLLSQVHIGLRPLRTLATRTEQVRLGQAERIGSDGLSSEIAPLAQQLDALLDHHQRMVSRARSSAQDLAHALKTPLSVLAAEAEGEGLHWRQTVREQGQRMQASITRYLASGLATDARQRTDVRPVAMALCRLMATVHGERAMAFDASAVPAGLRFAGDAADLEEMLGNLLDNAGKWAHRQVWVDATASAEGWLQLQVRDDGPGLPGHQLQSVLARGVRLDERDSSSGLGLAIVGDIVHSYGGSLQLHNLDPGLCARLLLPAG